MNDLKGRLERGGAVKPSSVKAKTKGAGVDYNALKKKIEKDSKRGGSKNELQHFLQEGRNHGRVCPRGKLVDGAYSEPFFVEREVHQVGPDNERLTCLGAKCPSCKRCRQKVAACNAKYKKGDPKGKKLWVSIVRAYQAQKRYFIWWLPYEDKKITEEPKLLEIGKMILDAFMDEITDTEGCGDFTSPKTGRVMQILKKKTGPNPFDVKYSVKAYGDPRKLLCWDKVRGILKGLDIEEEINKVYPVLSPAEFAKKMDGVSDGEDDDDSDDEDVAPKRRGKVSRSRDDESENESADDESEEPTQSKRERLRAALKAKRAKEKKRRLAA
jgi:hypothetical protein